MLSLLFQLLAGWLVAAGCYRLVKTPQTLYRLAGWGLGLAFGWHYLGSLYWDARMMLWGSFISVFGLLTHAGLLAATGLALAKGAKGAPPVPEPRRLPRR